MSVQAEKAKVFEELHQKDGVFVIPNPWDIGSARLLESLGFTSLATTSSGFAQTLGRNDGQVTPDEMFRHCADLCASTSIPISADLENCYGDQPEEVAHCLERFAESGIVGASVEDFAPKPDSLIYDFDHAVERVHAAVEAVSKFSFKFMLTARAENLIRGKIDIEDTIRRLQAFEKAGADVLYAPGLRTLDDVRLVVKSVSTPLNVLAPPLHKHTVADIGETGAKRVSTGGSLARLAAGVLVSAGSALLEDGSQHWIADTIEFAAIETAFSQE